MLNATKLGTLGRARLAMIAVVMLVTVLPAAAQLRREGDAWAQDATGVITGARSLRILADFGGIHLDRGTQGIHYKLHKRSYRSSEEDARRDLEPFRVISSNENGTATLRITGARRGGRFNIELFVEVPPEVELVKVETGAGGVNVRNINAKFDLSTQAGGIVVDHAPRGIKAQTMGGPVQISSAKGDVFIRSGGGGVMLGTINGRLDLSGMGGNINVQGVQSGSIQTAGGSINITRCEGELTARTAGGSVNLGELLGKTLVETGGGNIRVGSAKGLVVANTGGGNIELWKLYHGAQAQTGAGAITAEFLAGRGAFSESYLRTSAGDVVVYLNSGLPATVRASSEMASGRGIRSDFPELKISTEGGDFGPKTMFADGVLNGGGPLLKVRTTIGQIEFRRAK